MGAFIDLTNKQFNRLTVKEKLYKKGNEWYWLCECECGNTCEVSGAQLRSNRTKSCGCLKKETDRSPKGNVINLLNQTFGQLTVIARDGSDQRGEAKWLCQCSCGSEPISVLGSNLRTGHTQSCGCNRRSHGEIKIEQLLKENNIPFIAEKSLFKFSSGTNAYFDFYVDNKYIIEYDGETHFLCNLHGWHTKEQLTQQQERDKIKTQWCKDNNIPLIRIPYTHYKGLKIENLLLETSKFIV